MDVLWIMCASRANVFVLCERTKGPIYILQTAKWKRKKFPLKEYNYISMKQCCMNTLFTLNKTGKA